jgi:peptidyl-prolyl cis-trans isomerase SurA
MMHRRPSASRLQIGILALGLGALMTAQAVAEDSWPPKQGTIIDEIVAMVGNEPITRYELQRATGPFVQQLQTQGESITEIHAHKMQLEILQSLVDERLMLDEARQMKLEVLPADIDKEIAGIRAEKGWDDSKLATVLAQAGFPTIAAFRKHREKQRLVDQVINFRVRSRARVDEGEVAVAVIAELGTEGIVVQHRAAHILIRADEFVTEERTSEIQKMLLELRKQIFAGEISFEDAARRHSEDPAGRTGGDTGWFSKGDFVPTFERAISRLSIGQISLPTRTEFGFHLIKLIEERHNKPNEAERQELMTQIRMRMLKQESTRLYQHWLESLRRDTFIEIRLKDSSEE